MKSVYTQGFGWLAPQHDGSFGREARIETMCHPGAPVFFAGGTTAPGDPGIAAWIGSAAGLSGVAATNFSLALRSGSVLKADANMNTQISSDLAPKHSVLIVDDHKVVRQGLRLLIDKSANLCVCGEAADSEQGLAAIEAQSPSVVMVDISMPGMNGIEFIKQAKALHPDLPMVVLSMHDESLYAERALRAGALGYLMKTTGAEEMLAALGKAVKGEFCVSGEVG